MPWKVVMTFLLSGIAVDETAYKGLDVQFTKKLCRSQEEIIEFARDADAVVTGGQDFNKKVIDSLEKCRIIASSGIGYEKIDLKAATERGILVTNTPDYCVEEVSDHAMALILACNRKIVRLVDAVRAGKWDSVEKREIRYQIMPPMTRLRGLTLGLVGFGRIPRTMVPKAKGFGLRIIAYDPYVPAEVARTLGVELVDFDTIVTQSDFISIHAALTPETKNLFGLEQFRKMKRTAYLINTARGALVDQQALHQALTEGLIAGAALDVMEPEPPRADDPLLKLNNVIITAHSANFSDQAMIDLFSHPQQEVARVLSGQWPKALVNPQAKEKFTARFGRMR